MNSPISEKKKNWLQLETFLQENTTSSRFHCWIFQPFTAEITQILLCLFWVFLYPSHFLCQSSLAYPIGRSNPQLHQHSLTSSFVYSSCTNSHLQINCAFYLLICLFPLQCKLCGQRFVICSLLYHNIYNSVWHVASP